MTACGSAGSSTQDLAGAQLGQRCGAGAEAVRGRVRAPGGWVWAKVGAVGAVDGPKLGHVANAQLNETRVVRPQAVVLQARCSRRVRSGHTQPPAAGACRRLLTLHLIHHVAGLCRGVCARQRVPGAEKGRPQDAAAPRHAPPRRRAPWGAVDLVGRASLHLLLRTPHPCLARALCSAEYCPREGRNGSRLLAGRLLRHRLRRLWPRMWHLGARVLALGLRVPALDHVARDGRILVVLLHFRLGLVAAHKAQARESRSMGWELPPGRCCGCPHITIRRL